MPILPKPHQTLDRAILGAVYDVPRSRTQGAEILNTELLNLNYIIIILNAKVSAPFSVRFDIPSCFHLMDLIIPEIPEGVRVAGARRCPEEEAAEQPASAASPGGT